MNVVAIINRSIDKSLQHYANRGFSWLKIGLALVIVCYGLMITFLNSGAIKGFQYGWPFFSMSIGLFTQELVGPLTRREQFTIARVVWTLGLTALIAGIVGYAYYALQQLL